MSENHTGPTNSAVWNHLVNHGPTTAADLPGTRVNTELRADGVQRLYPTGHALAGAADSTGGQMAPVYYIKGKHDKVTVLRTFLDANPQLVEAKSANGLNQFLGKEWTEPFREIYDEYYDSYYAEERGGNASKGGTCPLCGVEYDATLPEHLPCEGNDE